MGLWELPIYNGFGGIDGNPFNMQGSGGSLFDLVTDNPFNDESINDLKDEYNKPGGLGLDDDFVREKLLETMIANSCGSAKTCDKLHLSNSVLSAIIDIVKIGVRESDLSKLNKSLATEAVQAEIKNTVDQFVVKNQTYDAAIERMTELLNSGTTLTDSDRNNLSKSIDHLNNEKRVSMNEFNQSISSLSQYQTRLESSRHGDYMGQSLENFPLLSDELRSLAIFMRQDHRMNGLSSDAAHVVTYRNEEQQRQSREDLNHYLTSRQERIERDNTPHTFTYSLDIGGHSYGFTSVRGRDRFFQELEQGAGR